MLGAKERQFWSQTFNNVPSPNKRLSHVALPSLYSNNTRSRQKDVYIKVIEKNSGRELPSSPSEPQNIKKNSYTTDVYPAHAPQSQLK